MLCSKLEFQKSDFVKILEKTKSGNELFCKAMQKKTISSFSCFASFENGLFLIPKTGTKIWPINQIYGIFQKLTKLTKLTKHTKKRSKMYILSQKAYIWGQKHSFLYIPYIRNTQKMANFWYPKLVQKYRVSVLNILKKIQFDSYFNQIFDYNFGTHCLTSLAWPWWPPNDETIVVILIWVIRRQTI